MAFDSLVSSALESSYLSKQLFARSAAGDLNALECYHANGWSIDAQDEDGLALIHYAACYGDISLMRILREYGADMNLMDDGTPQWKPIHYAIFHRRHEAEEILKTFGAEVPLPILKKCLRDDSASQKSGARPVKTGHTRGIYGSSHEFGFKIG